MQWSDGENAGFSTAQPWIMLNPNYRQINAAAEAADPDSVLNDYKRLIKLRSSERTLIYGTCEFLPSGSEDLLRYERRLDGTEFTVLYCMGSKQCRNLPDVPGELVLCNVSRPQKCVLQPYEARVYRRSI